MYNDTKDLYFSNQCCFFPPTFYSFQGFRRITKNSATVFNIDNGKNVNWVY